MSTSTSVKPAAKALGALIIGIKRHWSRQRDNEIFKANEDFRSLRAAALARAQYRCVFCGFRSKKTNEIYHIDGNHNNNKPENMACVCTLCHPYNHVGETPKSGEAIGIDEGHLGGATRLIRVPDAGAITAQDMNHLLRVIGIALADDKERDKAREVFNLICNSSALDEISEAMYASAGDGKKVKRVTSQDMCMAFRELTDDEYAERVPVIEAVRMMYSPNQLAKWGWLWSSEQPAFADPTGWERLLEKPMALVAKKSPSGVASGPSVGIESVMIDPISGPDDDYDEDMDDE